MANQRTPLYQSHVDLGARLVPFGGWDMPVQYKTGIKKEHLAVRENAGAFDVSHMGEISLAGDDALSVVQRLATNDVAKILPKPDAPHGRALYTVMCNESGGIVDDCIVYCRSANDFLIIVNASNIDKDREWIQRAAGTSVDVVDESDKTGLIAVQGPRARDIVSALADADVMAVKRFHFAKCAVAGVHAVVARTGYTGEDGFELACAADDAPALWDAILEKGATPIGLGARDTLRLEARLSLYGNDIDETTTPYEAGLGWVVKPAAKDFIGKDALVRQKERGLERKLVGFKIEGRGIARHGYPIRHPSSGEDVGNVTSGTVGISVGGAIGLGYVPLGLSSPGTLLSIDCRGKDVAAEVVSGPFYKRD